MTRSSSTPGLPGIVSGAATPRDQTTRPGLSLRTTATPGSTTSKPRTTRRHVPEGRYDAIVVKGHVHKYRWTDKKESRRFVLTFELINKPEVAGTRLQFVCELRHRVGGKGKFMRAWEVANGGPAKRRDRLKLNVFRNRMFVVEVGNVNLD
jgi:hypothetical protein